VISEPEEEVQVSNKRAVKKRKLNHLDAHISLSSSQIKAQLQDTSDLLKPRVFVPISRSAVEIARNMAMGADYFLKKTHFSRVPKGAQGIMSSVRVKAIMAAKKVEARKRASIGMTFVIFNFSCGEGG
jgi:predicted nucleotide-binding protein